jgi:hypothetical protein
MPLGSGECSASMWVDSSGDMHFYLMRSDSVNELASRDKLAKIRVRLDPPLDIKTTTSTTTVAFTQRLVLATATVVVTVGNVSVHAFIDANADALRVRVTGAVPTTTLTASIEVWRTAPAPAQGEFCEAWNRSADTLITREPPTTAAESADRSEPVLPFAVSEIYLSFCAQRRSFATCCFPRHPLASLVRMEHNHAANKSSVRNACDCC